MEGGWMEEKDRHGIDGGSEEVVAGKRASRCSHVCTGCMRVGRNRDRAVFSWSEE